MDKPPHQIEIKSLDFPSGLKSVDDAARDLGMSSSRLLGLADGGFAPHCRVDGGPPLFKASELK
jgi:hypothetical protein